MISKVLLLQVCIKFNSMMYACMILIIDGIKVLLDVNYSPRDSSERVKEEATFMLFLDQQ